MRQVPLGMEFERLGRDRLRTRTVTPYARGAAAWGLFEMSERSGLPEGKIKYAITILAALSGTRVGSMVDRMLQRGMDYIDERIFGPKRPSVTIDDTDRFRGYQ